MEVTWSEPITMLKWIILSGNSIFFPLETSIIQSVWSLHLIIILSNKVLKIFDFNSHFHFITGTEVENNWLILISGKSKSWLFLILGKPWQRSRIDNKTEMIIGSCYPNRFINDETSLNRLVEASGAPPMVNSCFSLLRKGAKLVLIGKLVSIYFICSLLVLFWFVLFAGLPKSAIHIENPLQNVIFKSITLTTVHGRY